MALSLAHGRPQERFELIAWVFMRVSGVILLIMALGHFAMMHLINDIEVVNFAFVASRYARPFWRAYDLVMLILALLHGLNGARTLIDDHVAPVRLRRFSLGLLSVVGAVFLLIGVFAIVTFDPINPPFVRMP